MVWETSPDMEIIMFFFVFLYLNWNFIQIFGFVGWDLNAQSFWGCCLVWHEGWQRMVFGISKGALEVA